MLDENRAATNLALALRLQSVAGSVVNDLDAQYRDNGARPHMKLTAGGLAASDRLAINNTGIRVSRFRDTTILQLVARDESQKILTMVEARSGDPPTSQPATSSIRQIRTGALL